MSVETALSTLNAAQRDAVLHFDSPLLILAGAGSGKTRVVTVKIAYALDRLGADPYSILAVTFTNKAAGEMRQRAAALDSRAAQAQIRTFHSFGAWFLRRNADAIGLSSAFSVYDTEDQVTLLRTVFGDYDRATLRRYVHLISRAKDYFLEPDDDLRPISGDPELPHIYREYQRRLREIGNVDFGDLIMVPAQLLERDEVLRSRTQGRFRYVMVDEYQDSNVAQYRLLQALVGPQSFVAVVGDDDQSIYRFRGAEVQNILTFPDRFPDTKVVRLEQNYRSTAPILELAGAVVARNESRLGKTLFTTREDGALPVLRLLDRQEAEVDLVLDEVHRVLDDPAEPTLAVLYRTNAQSRPFETALSQSRINYRIVGTLRFYEREEIRDAVALLRYVANTRDRVSFQRIVNKPTRGIGPKTVAQVLEQADRGTPELDQAIAAAADTLSKRARTALTNFSAVIESIRAALTEATEGSTLARVVEAAVVESGLQSHHREQDVIAGTQKLQNLEELANAASLYPATVLGLAEFLEAIELDSLRGQEDDQTARVILITMHNTKGLEFDRVIIAGMDDGLFPRDDGEDFEEERRLLYVAVTRARDELTLTSCRQRVVRGRLTELVPSRFLSEIPENLIATQAQPGAARFGRDGTSSSDHPWPPGTGVYHDSYGRGVVTKAWYTGPEACILVRFETGATAQFLPAYTPLERIALDEWD